MLKKDSIVIATEFLASHPEISDDLDKRQVVMGCMSGKLGLISIPKFPTEEEHRKFLVSVTNTVPWDALIFMTKNWIVLNDNKIVRFIKQKNSEETKCVFSLILLFEGQLYISYSNSFTMELQFTDWIACNSSCDGECFVPIKEILISSNSDFNNIIEGASEIIKTTNTEFDVILEATKIINFKPNSDQDLLDNI